MVLGDTQSVPKIFSNSYNGKQIKLTLNLSPSIIIGHFEHTTKVDAFSEAGVKTRSLKCNSLTSKHNSSTKILDSKERVTPKSYNTLKLLPTIEHTP